MILGGASAQSVVPYRVCQQTQSSSSQVWRWTLLICLNPPVGREILCPRMAHQKTRLFGNTLWWISDVWCFMMFSSEFSWCTLPFVSWGLGMVTCGIFFILSSNNSNKDTSMKDEWLTSHFSLFFSISQNDTLKLKLQRINKGVAELCRGDFSRRPCEIVDLELLQWNPIG